MLKKRIIGYSFLPATSLASPVLHPESITSQTFPETNSQPPMKAQPSMKATPLTVTVRNYVKTPHLLTNLLKAETPITLDFTEAEMDEEEINTIAEQCNHLAGIIFSEEIEISSNTLEKILMHHDTIQTLHYHIPSTSPQHSGKVIPLPKVLKRLSSLTNLSLHNSSVTDRQLLEIIPTLTKLEGLCLHNCPHITDNGLNGILMACPRIKDLKLSGLPLITDTAFYNTNLTNLRSLFLGELDSPSQGGLNSPVGCSDKGLIPFLKQNKSLRKLTLKNLPRLSGATLFTIGHELPALESLDLTGCHGIDEKSWFTLISSSLTESTSGKFYSPLQQVKNLILDDIKAVTADIIYAITLMIPSITYISAKGCHTIDTMTLERKLESNGTLKVNIYTEKKIVTFTYTSNTHNTTIVLDASPLRLKIPHKLGESGYFA